MQEKVKNQEISLYKVLGLENPADMCTKHLARPALNKCLAELGVRFEAGRPTSAPEVAAEVETFL